MIHAALFVIAMAYCLTVIAIGAWIRFSNPHLTETQLLIEFWEFWVAAAFSALPVAIVYRMLLDRRR